MMGVMQCGLNWTVMLNKREIFRQYFDSFDYEKVIHCDKEKIQEIMEAPGMTRSPRKIQAIITNARAYLKIIQEYGFFDRLLWSYTDGKTFVCKSHQQCPTVSNDVLDAINKELKKRGFKYLGFITVYSHPQACGMINDYKRSYFLYRQLCDGNSVEYRD